MALSRYWWSSPNSRDIIVYFPFETCLLEILGEFSTNPWIKRAILSRKQFYSFHSDCTGKVFSIIVSWINNNNNLSLNVYKRLYLMSMQWFKLLNILIWTCDLKLPREGEKWGSSPHLPSHNRRLLMVHPTGIADTRTTWMSAEGKNYICKSRLYCICDQIQHHRISFFYILGLGFLEQAI